MATKENDFLKKLLATFKAEAEEHLQAMFSGLLALEKKPPAKERREIIETIFREAHSLKGAARSANLDDIETVCQSLETVFSALKRSEVSLSQGLMDALHNTLNFVSKLVFSAQSADQSLMQDLLKSLEMALKGTPLKRKKQDGATAPEPDAKPLISETVRISASTLDTLLLETEELLSAKITILQRAVEIRRLMHLLSAWKKEWAKVQPSIHGKSNGQLKTTHPALLSFLEWNSAFLKSLENQISSLVKFAEQDARTVGGMVDNLLQDMKKASMLPFSSLLDIFPKFVRDLSRSQGKEVELRLQGGEIEADRRILEEMKDPLMHLVRNSVDHGIEKPQERKKKHKREKGILTMGVIPKNGNKIELAVSDDGAGIDVEKIRAAAVKLNLQTTREAQKLTYNEILSLIFESGVSTSPIITDISGRGLGLAIVREKCEKLGGLIHVETRQDRGTTFRIILPVTLSSFRGVLISAAGNVFLIPSTSVERAVRIRKENIKTVENRETIEIQGQALSLVRVSDVLGLPGKSTQNNGNDYEQALVLGSAQSRMAFLVDEILGEQEVLVKNPGRQLSRVRNIAGATVLGDGKVAPVLNIPDMLKSAVKETFAPSREKTETSPEKAPGKIILVVEDSITARTLLKNILEGAGYEVRTAVDGVDALTALKTESVDLVVSDIEMPRMDGFNLTAKIRSEKKLAEMPVVLVTALESREDRERGIDAGANAYIVKSSFDQSNLLEVVGRLI